MLGLDYSSSEEEEEEEQRKQEESVHQLQVEVPDKTHASTSNASVEDEKKSKLVLPSAADVFAGGCSDGLARKGSVSATKPSPVLSGSKRPPPSPILNPRQGQQKNPSSIGKHNSLLPPQLRGRANTPTTDLEGLGLRVTPPSRRNNST